MPAKESIYGLLGPKKLNPNVIVIGVVFIVIILILVFSGRHNRVTVSNGVSIETNIPSDSSKRSEK